MSETTPEQTGPFVDQSQADDVEPQNEAVAEESAPVAPSQAGGALDLTDKPAQMAPEPSGDLVRTTDAVVPLPEP